MNAKKTSLLSLILIGALLTPGCKPTDSLKTKVHKATVSAKAANHVLAESIRAVIHQVDPTKFTPPDLPITIGFIPNEAGDGGRTILDFEDGVTLEPITVAGRIHSDFVIGLDNETKMITVEIWTTFTNFWIHVGENDTILEGKVTLNGTVKVATTLQGRIATCVITHPLDIKVNKEQMRLYTGGMNAVLDGIDGTVIFNGTARLDTTHYGDWGLTCNNLLFRLNTASIDSGRLKVERYGGLVKWKTIWLFTYPNGGDKTTFPGGNTEPFYLGSGNYGPDYPGEEEDPTLAQ